MARSERIEALERTGGNAWAGLPIDALKARVRAALDPLDSHDARSPQSDHDLNPEIALPLDGLQSAAVLIALIERPSGLTVLFTQRAGQLRRHAGQISFPGGSCDEGETAPVTALREAHEEVALDPALVELAGLSTPYRTLTGYHIVPVVGFVDPAALFTASPAEVADLFEVPFAFLMDPANHERRHRDQPPAPPRWHWAIVWPDEQGMDRNIWGATAGMIRTLYERLAGSDDVGA